MDTNIKQENPISLGAKKIMTKVAEGSRKTIDVMQDVQKLTEKIGRVKFNTDEIWNRYELELDAALLINALDNNLLSSGDPIAAKYIKEAVSAPRLSDEEEEALIAKAAKGEIEAINKLLEARRFIVVALAYPFIGSGVPFDKLVDAGEEFIIDTIIEHCTKEMTLDRRLLN